MHNYEIHVTLPTEITEPKFREFCKTVDCKPLIIKNYRYDGGSYLEYITSTMRQSETDSKAYSVIKDIYFVAVELGYSIVRGKIEKQPNDYDSLDRNQYFETHVEFPSTLPISALKDSGFYISQVFDKVVGTYRSNTTLYARNFRSEVVQKFNIKNFETEWCIYDTNKGLDKDWINSYASQFKASPSVQI